MIWRDMLESKKSDFPANFEEAREDFFSKKLALIYFFGGVDTIQNCSVQKFSMGISTNLAIGLRKNSTLKSIFNYQ